MMGTDGQDIAFEGYASVFNVVDDAHDVVAPGAFSRALASQGARHVRLLWQHDPARPIGIWRDIREDAYGLRVCGRLFAALGAAREAAVLIQNGGIDGLSIGFRVKGGARDRATGVRHIHEIDLWEISIVTFPQNPMARIMRIAPQQ